MNLYNEISFNYINYESAGSIIIIKTENKVIAALKISNSEMQFITKMKNKINSLLIDEAFNSDIFINKLIKIYSLPRDISIYKSIFNNLILPNESFLKMKNIQFILQNDELKKKFSNTIKNKQTFSESLNISTDISQCSSYIKHSSKTTFPLKKETNAFNIDDPFDKKLPSQNYFIQSKQKQKKKVQFVDDIYNIPLVEITLIQSFKQFNAVNNYSNNIENENTIPKKLSCCIVF